MIPRCDHKDCNARAFWVWVNKNHEIIEDEGYVDGERKLRDCGWVCNQHAQWVEERFPNDQYFFPWHRRKKNTQGQPLRVRNYDGRLSNG